MILHSVEVSRGLKSWTRLFMKKNLKVKLFTWTDDRIQSIITYFLLPASVFIWYKLSTRSIFLCCLDKISIMYISTALIPSVQHSAALFKRSKSGPNWRKYIMFGRRTFVFCSVIGSRWLLLRGWLDTDLTGSPTTDVIMWSSVLPQPPSQLDAAWITLSDGCFYQCADIRSWSQLLPRRLRRVQTNCVWRRRVAAPSGKQITVR